MIVLEFVHTAVTTPLKKYCLLGLDILPLFSGSFETKLLDKLDTNFAQCFLMHLHKISAKIQIWVKKGQDPVHVELSQTSVSSESLFDFVSSKTCSGYVTKSQRFIGL